MRTGKITAAADLSHSEAVIYSLFPLLQKIKYTSNRPSLTGEGARRADEVLKVPA